MPAVRILGIDPGLAVTGYGLVESAGGKLHYVASGRIRSQVSDSLPTRIGTLFAGLNEVIAAFSPTEVVVEKVFVNVNPQSTLLLGQARGAAIAAAVAAGLPVSEYTALQVKKSVVGIGHAGKEQVQDMVRRLLALPSSPGSDAADALACAICHAHSAMGPAGTGLRGRRMRGGRYV